MEIHIAIMISQVWCDYNWIILLQCIAVALVLQEACNAIQNLVLHSFSTPIFDNCFSKYIRGKFLEKTSDE